MTDIQIAQAAKKENIVEIAKKLGLTEDDIEQYGKYKAKVNLDVLQKSKRPNGKLIFRISLSSIMFKKYSPFSSNISTTTTQCHLSKLFSSPLHRFKKAIGLSSKSSFSIKSIILSKLGLFFMSTFM